ncbi:hypothetical protein E4U42_003468 [Claviceps africana]|uniref:Cyanovirin-N domain-containing protein n=1 Tax=Claviceps africana TaxID=83212 RepID=A0A8K0JCA3_9HYPO|nr:hypothetical protein E4U42_003468 [Claviceps africana]
MHFPASTILAAVALYAGQTLAYCSNDGGGVKLDNPCHLKGSYWICDTNGGGSVKQEPDGLWVTASNGQSLTIKAICSKHNSQTLVVSCPRGDLAYYNFECPEGDTVEVFSPAAF